MVVGIFRFVHMMGDPLAYTNFEFLADSMHIPGQAASYRIITGDHDAASQQQLTRRIDDYLNTINEVLAYE